MTYYAINDMGNFYITNLEVTDWNYAEVYQLVQPDITRIVCTDGYVLFKCDYLIKNYNKVYRIDFSRLF